MCFRCNAHDAGVGVTNPGAASISAALAGDQRRAFRQQRGAGQCGRCGVASSSVSSRLPRGRGYRLAKHGHLHNARGFTRCYRWPPTIKKRTLRMVKPNEDQSLKVFLGRDTRETCQREKLLVPSRIRPEPQATNRSRPRLVFACRRTIRPGGPTQPEHKIAPAYCANENPFLYRVQKKTRSRKRERRIPVHDMADNRKARDPSRNGPMINGKSIGAVDGSRRVAVTLPPDA